MIGQIAGQKGLRAFSIIAYMRARFASQSRRGPFVYRLGRQVFNLKRGVRLP